MAKNVTAYQKINGELTKLHYKTSAAQVIVGDNSTVDAELTAIKTSLETFLNGPADGGTIDRLSELVASIEANKNSIDDLVANHLTPDDIVNDLTTGGAAKALAAEQGKALKALIDAINTTLEAVQEKTDKITVDDDGNVAVDGLETKAYVMHAATLPDAVPAELADGGLLIVG